MIAGYITYDELKIITGFSDAVLSRLLNLGINQHQLHVETGIYNQKVAKHIKQCLFNLKEVENWIRLHVY